MRAGIMARWILCLVLFSIFLNNAYANSTEHEGGLWDKLSLSGHLFPHGKAEYEVETHTKFLFNDSGFDQDVNRVALGYPLINQLSLWLGYDFVPTHKAEGIAYDHRVWQQIKWQLCKKDFIDLAARSRIEERWRVDNAGMGARYRQQLMLKLPNLISDKISPLTFDEIFFNVTHPNWVSNKTFEQNRTFVGLEFRLSKKINFDFGYLNQLLFRTANNQMNHIVYLALYLKTEP